MLSPSDIALHRARIEADGFTILEDAIEPELVDVLAADIARLERDLHIESAGNVFEGARTRRVYNLLARGPSFQAVPVHPNVLPLVESVLDRGCLVSSILVDPHRAGRGGAAAARGRSAHPAPAAARAHRVQHHVGPHRLHARQRRHEDSAAGATRTPAFPTRSATPPAWSPP